MRIFIASDHAGIKEKDEVVKHLNQKYKDYTINDIGPYTEGSVDYPYYAYKVSKEVCTCCDYNHCIGILICGTGIGMDMVANKFNEIRAARCLNTEDARLSRVHNNANVLCLGAGNHLLEYDILEIVDTFINTEFSDEERHYRRIDLMNNLDYRI